MMDSCDERANHSYMMGFADALHWVLKNRGECEKLMRGNVAPRPNGLTPMMLLCLQAADVYAQGGSDPVEWVNQPREKIERLRP